MVKELLLRNVADRIGLYLETFRVLMIGGARQAGKTTLLQDVLSLPDGAAVTLDDEATRQRAIEDPVGFVRGLPRPAAIDEFQRAGQGLLLAIKRAADDDSTPGHLILTGSTNYLADRSVPETLAGRAGRVVLWPFSGGERMGIRESFIDHLFDVGAWPWRPQAILTRREIADRVLEGGFPEVVTRQLTGHARRAWFDSYVTDVVSREALRPIADVRLESELRHVLRLLAARTGQELVISDIAADAALDRETVSSYITLLEALYLVKLVPAWSSGATTRAKRRPKVVIADSGLGADLCGVGDNAFDLTADGVAAGALFETFVLGELLKQVTWSDRTVDVLHYRDRDGREVDAIIEDRRSGQIAGVEIKLTATPRTQHARHLAMLRDRLKSRFSVGIVLHTGDQVLSMGDRLWAVPVAAIWRE